MSLATRCPACTTSFRVVQDQLKVSAGWVRCGRCGEVFNALEGLFDLETETPGAVVQTHATVPAGDAASPAVTDTTTADTVQAAGELQAAAAPSPGAPSPGAAEAAAPEAPASPPGADAATPEPTTPPAAAPPAPLPTFVSAPAAPLPPLPTPVNSAFILPAGATLITAAPRPAPESQPPESELELTGQETDARDLSFVRQAERAARWHHPGVRALLSLLALSLLALLVGQWLVAQRDWAAARWPALREPLVQLCASLGCQVQPPRRIEALAVESSGFTRVEGAPLYRVSLVLRNKADILLALPAVDLTVTDPTGQVVSRRVLQPAEMGATQAALPAGQEVTLQALLAAGDRRLAGYSVEIFYP